LIGDRDDRIIERRVNVNLSVRHRPFGFSRACPLRLLSFSSHAILSNLSIFSFDEHDALLTTEFAAGGKDTRSGINAQNSFERLLLLRAPSSSTTRNGLFRSFAGACVGSRSLTAHR